MLPRLFRRRGDPLPFPSELRIEARPIPVRSEVIYGNAGGERKQEKDEQ